MKPWPQLRAGIILLAIVFGLVDGCPLPPPAQTPAWERGFVEPIRAVQRFVLRPVAWIGDDLRVAQRWALYQAPTRDRYRLWVEAQTADGRWTLLFRAGDPAHTAYASLIDSSRPRGTWDPATTVPVQYPLFARWLTQRVLDDNPAYIASRVRIEKVTLTDDGLIASGQFIQPHVAVRSGPR